MGNSFLALQARSAADCTPSTPTLFHGYHHQKCPGCRLDFPPERTLGLSSIFATAKTFTASIADNDRTLTSLCFTRDCRQD